MHDKYGNSYPDKINEYGILQVFLKVRQNRIFDLRNLEHKRIYDFTYKRILKNLIKNDIPDQLTDGVVINYMFNILKFQRKYDLIIANYFFKRKIQRPSGTTTVYRTNPNLCENTRIIRKMKEYRWESHFPRYYEIWKSQFVDAQPFHKRIVYVYSSQNLYTI